MNQQVQEGSLQQERLVQREGAVHQEGLVQQEKTAVREGKAGINANGLKLIAIAAMTIDHLTWVLFPGYPDEWWILLLHAIGRLTAPMMCFFIAEGYHYTRSVRKYAMRLLLFAVISHFAYNFAFGISFVPFADGEILNQTGVIWALFFGLIALALADGKRISLPKWADKQWVKILLIAICCVLAFPADWSCIAVLVIMQFGLNRGNLKKQMVGMIFYVAMYAAVYAVCIDWKYGLLQMMVVIVIPFLRHYNGQRGKWRGMKWFFYLYYPLHLIACGVIRVLMSGI